MTDKKALIAVAIPFVLLCLLIARAEYHLKSGEEWTFAVAGYDPRDLLRGHYLRFSLDYDWEDYRGGCSPAESCCLCLTRTDEMTPSVHETSCTVARNECDGFMVTDQANALNRFYVAETEASRAEQILREARAAENAHIRISVNARGEPRIVDLLIGDRPLEELLKESGGQE